MLKPKIFIGASKEDLLLARALANGLEECAVVKVWNEVVFEPNRGFLESLLEALTEYDFAAFILGSDDLTISRDESKPSPRDNVLFESGLFMGVLGRERVFLIYDRSAELKIPSDLSGVKIASYDGMAVADLADAEGRLRKSCDLVAERIRKSTFPSLAGEWRSKYIMSGDIGAPFVEEDVYITVYSDVVSFTVINNPQHDYYTASGRMILDNQMTGKWRNARERFDEKGLFILTIGPSATFMYGFCTGQDESGGPVYGPWVLAKKVGADDALVSERLKAAEATLGRAPLSFAHSQ